MLSVREPFGVVAVISDDAEVADAAETVRGGLLPSLGRRALGVITGAGELDEVKDPSGDA